MKLRVVCMGVSQGLLYARLSLMGLVCTGCSKIHLSQTFKDDFCNLFSNYLSAPSLILLILHYLNQSNPCYYLPAITDSSQWLMNQCLPPYNSSVFDFDHQHLRSEGNLLHSMRQRTLAFVVDCVLASLNNPYQS